MSHTKTQAPSLKTQVEPAEFAPYIISWNLTQRCNLRCKHCYIDASAAMPGELTTEEAKHVMDQIGDIGQETMLILSGGEPLLRQDLDTLVEHAAGLGFMVVLGTNGTLLTADRSRSLSERGLTGLGISLDSLVASRHDAFRGVAGAWKAAIAGIKAAQQAGLDTQIQMTITHNNMQELADVALFSRAAGVRVLTLFFLVCTGRGQDLVDLSPQEYEEVLQWLVDTPHDGVMIRPRCAPTFRRVLAQTFPESPLLKSDAGRCMAGRNYCRITPNGDVTPCPYMPLAAGNVREKSFGDIWWSSPLFQQFRQPIRQGRCGECEYLQLCGGCRARAFAQTGDPLAEDPWCTHQPGTGAALPAPQQTALRWMPESEARLEKVPFFVRKTVRAAIEAYARGKGLETITPELLNEARRRMMPS